MSTALRDTISTAIRSACDRGSPALVAYLTAGFPKRETFLETLDAVASAADVIEIGVPFTDPMADGLTIQRSSRVALEQGVSLKWILEELTRRQAAVSAPSAPLLLMSYLNPLLAFGLEQLPRAAAAAGVAGFIVPDLPFEECAEMRTALEREGIALVQMVTPVTPQARLEKLCAASAGFVYAVTMTGTTGKNVAVPDEVLAYMDRVKKVSPVPVCAGFGIRTSEQVARLSGHVDGVVIGSALVEVLESGADPAVWLAGLRRTADAPRVDEG